MTLERLPSKQIRDTHECSNNYDGKYRDRDTVNGSVKISAIRGRDGEKNRKKIQIRLYKYHLFPQLLLWF